jgi:hypothetical protein
MPLLFALLLLLSLSSTFATPSGGTQPETPTPEPTNPPVARDIGVADLPLLDQAAPETDDETVIPDPVIGGPDSSLNPFAPLVLPQQPSTPQPQTPETAQPEASEDAAPAAPETTPAPAAPSRAPSPSAPAPEVRVSRPSIPTALGEGMVPTSATPLSAALRPLETVLGGQTPLLGDPLGGALATRTPSSLPPLAAAPTRLGSPGGVAQHVAGSGLTPLTFAGTMLGDDENATSLVSNRVSRSLENLRISFTAMSTGTGIFRVGDSTRPILLAVGQRLPGTGLTLSSLDARSAEFTEDDVRHRLLLNP